MLPVTRRAQGIAGDRALLLLAVALLRLVVAPSLNTRRPPARDARYSYDGLLFSGMHATNTRRLLDHLGIEEAAVVGHSFGGMLATRLPLMDPGATTHLVLVNQIGLADQRLSRPWHPTEEVYREELGRDLAAIRATFERYDVECRPESERHVRIHHGCTLSGDWPRMAMIRALNRQVNYSEPVVHDWPHLRVPTLVIGVEVDGPDLPALARRSAEAIPGSELVLFPDVGHNPHLEAPELLHPARAWFLLTDPLP